MERSCSLTNLKLLIILQFSSVQSFSRVQLYTNTWTAECQASLPITSSQSSPKLMSIESMIPSSHLILCRPFLLLPSIFPATGTFPRVSTLALGGQSIGVSASASVFPMNEHPGLISFRMNWLDLLTVQGTLKFLLQHHSSKGSLVLSLPYGLTLTSIHDFWKIHSLDYFLPISEIVKSFSLYCLVWGLLATGVMERLKCG